MTATDCARGCLLFALHVPLEGRDEHPEECEGCAPRPAEVGGYCMRCALALRDVLRELPQLIDALYDMPGGRLAPVERKTGDSSRRATKVDQGSPSPAHDTADEAAHWLNAWALMLADELDHSGPFAYRIDGLPHLSPRDEVGYLLGNLRLVCAQPWANDLNDEARQMRHRLIQATGSDSGDRRLPARCPRCNQKSLVRPNGTEDIECRNARCVA